ncbi:site-specific integrase [Bosea sp. (in: a-proteobacteria)]|uniref:site-specific integrase n=1 Tax=Bosea sp. (in: a-proteobacteria) TaxID=1871050 RepID=UPI001AC0FCE2|nr:site-specific integrase [Bosea sp. (in: a-proteobacteria)]MBN9440427.1 site-specific integrase [Bosea sp. (in: a-proteobacteria)]
MALATNIVKRPGSSSYYLRVKFPGEAQRWVSLRTASPTEAKLRAPGVLQQLQDEHHAHKHGRELVESDIGAIAFQHYSNLIEKDERFREGHLTNADLDELWRLIEAEFGENDIGAYRIFERIRDHAARVRKARAQSRAALTSGKPELAQKPVAKSVAKYLAERHTTVTPGTRLHAKVVNAVQRGEMEALKRMAERDAMDWTGTPADPLVKRAEKPKAALPGSRIMDHYDRFLKQRASDISPDTISQNRGVVQLFAEFVGEDLPVDQLRRKHVAEWRDQLYLMPKMAKQVTALKNLKFKQVIAANQKLGRPTIDPKTINRYLSALSPFAKWLAANDMIGNPIMVDDMFIKLDRTKPKRAPFSDEQLKALFDSPLFRGCLSNTAEHKPGNFTIRDWRYWLPLVALFSGMRLGEIAQLLVEDVQEMHGTWVMHVTTDGDDEKKLKTVGSERIVPVHSELITLGFLDYYTARKEAGSKRLFPEIKPDSRGFMSGVPSKFLNTYLARIGVKTKTLAMHSFRHLFADRLRSAGYLDGDFGFILGHGDRLVRTTGRYGALPQGTVEHRKKLVEAVTFTDLDLKALYPAG